MTSTLQIVSFGDELGLVLSEEFLTRHGLKEGDELHLTETSDEFELSSDLNEGSGIGPADYASTLTSSAV